MAAMIFSLHFHFERGRGRRRTAMLSEAKLMTVVRSAELFREASPSERSLRSFRQTIGSITECHASPLQKFHGKHLMKYEGHGNTARNNVGQNTTLYIFLTCGILIGALPETESDTASAATGMFFKSSNRLKITWKGRNRRQKMDQKTYHKLTAVETKGFAPKLQ